MACPPFRAPAFPQFGCRSVGTGFRQDCCLLSVPRGVAVSVDSPSISGSPRPWRFAGSSASGHATWMPSWVYRVQHPLLMRDPGCDGLQPHRQRRGEALISSARYWISCSVVIAVLDLRYRLAGSFEQRAIVPLEPASSSAKAAFRIARRRGARRSARHLPRRCVDVVGLVATLPHLERY